MNGFIENNAIEKDLAPYSRRSFLKVGAMVGVGVSASLVMGCAEQRAQNHSQLSASDAEIYDKLARVMFPADEQMFPISKVPVLDNINHLISSLPEGVQGDLSGALKLFNYGAVILGWHLSSFINLNQASAAGYVDRWQSGNELQRGIMTALKKLVYTAYWRDERTWSAVSFDGPVSDKWGLKKLGNAPMPVE